MLKLNLGFFVQHRADIDKQIKNLDNEKKENRLILLTKIINIYTTIISLIEEYNLDLYEDDEVLLYKLNLGWFEQLQDRQFDYVVDKNERLKDIIFDKEDENFCIEWYGYEFDEDGVIPARILFDSKWKKHLIDKIELYLRLEKIKIEEKEKIEFEKYVKKYNIKIFH